MAGFVGFKARRGPPPTMAPAELAAAAGLGHGGDVHAGLAGPILDFAVLKAARGKRTA